MASPDSPTKATIIVNSVSSSTADGAYPVSAEIQIEVTFSDVVIVSGVPRLQLETGSSDRYATYSLGSGTAVLRFVYVVQAGDSSADLDFLSTNALGLNGGTITGNIPVELTRPAVGGANSLAGKKNIVVDTVAPSPVTSVSLYSDTTSGIHASISTSPDLNISTTASDVGAGVKDFQYQLIRTADSMVIVDWTPFGNGQTMTTRFTSLSLMNTEVYKFSIRVRDLANNFSTSVDSNTFTIQTAVTPYDGLGLADPTTLSDLSLSSVNVDGATYTRTSPRQGKTVTIAGTIGWSNRAAVFLRADVLSVNAGAEISASGTNGTDGSGSVGGAGGAGGSGGGGGAGSNGSVANGGAGGSGGNGTIGGVVSGTAGAAGAGTGSVYNGGYSYGSGGSGGSGENSGGTAGSGGAGLNGAGGGGGGGATGTIYGSNATSGGGGGGGGGLVVVVANSVAGYGSIKASGGNGAKGNVHRYSGGGGGGVIWMASKVYSGNLIQNVNGGSGRNRGADGLAKIFQINADGTLTQRAFSDSWGNDSIATKNNLPFSSAIDVNVLGSSSLTNTTIDTSIYHRGNPFAALDLTITGSVAYSGTNPAAMFFIAKNLILNDAIISSVGTAGSNGSGSTGGAGGFGASGGAGGSGTNGGTAVSGGIGGSANPGFMGYLASAAVGSGGISTSYNTGFSFGTGGSGGAGANSGGSGGAGVSGGGGGGGSAALPTGPGSGGGGGGGGGGLITIVAETITGAATLQVLGGAAGVGSTINRQGGGGGGGVIWVAAKNYSANFTANVSGGDGATAGSAGESKIFQINTDGTITQRSFDQTWTFGGTPTTNYLPVSAGVDLSSYSDQTLTSTTINGTLYSIGNPYTAKNLTINGTLSYTPGQPAALFLRADNLILNQPIISADGTAGTAGTVGVGGSGGTGASGGGGGSGTNGGSTVNGANGGSGAAGADGGFSSGSPGIGGLATWSRYKGPFFFGVGGTGGNGYALAGVAGSGGAGVDGGGGGGGSGSAASGSVGIGSGGGGGGGGLVMIVANTISGSALVQARGGNGGLGSTINRQGGGGGGGVVWVAAKNYNANIVVNVNGGIGGNPGAAGTSKIFQINTDGSLTQRSFSDSWTYGASPVAKTLPFSSDIDVTSASDQALSNTTLNPTVYTQGSPYTARVLNISGTLSPTAAKGPDLFIRARDIVFTAATVSVNGSDGGNSSASTGGAGGFGASGGAGASGSNGCCNMAGFAGGSNNLGLDGSFVSGGPGFGALGLARDYQSSFSFGLGGTGGAGFTGTAAGGAGGAGFDGGGGGGGSGAVNSGGTAGGGGGGGAGQIVMVADSITGTATIEAKGGNGGNGTSGNYKGGGGGGGVIWIATKSYTGAITANVSGGTGANAGASGTAKIFKIETDGSLTQKSFSDSW